MPLKPIQAGAMILADALDAFKALELKMSEVCLWCSLHFDDIELCQFFRE
jgi:hypothetical protein